MKTIETTPAASASWIEVIMADGSPTPPEVREAVIAKATAPASRHTPGPWVVIFPHINTCDCASICEVYDGDRLDGCDSNEANARLIAAAPDLLTALEQVLPLVAQYVKLTTKGAPSYIVARAAIAKATGGAQ